METLNRFFSLFLVILLETLSIRLLCFSYDCVIDLDTRSTIELGQVEISLAEVVQGRLRHGKKMQKCTTRDAVLYVSARETVDCRVRLFFRHQFHFQTYKVMIV